MSDNRTIRVRDEVARCLPDGYVLESVEVMPAGKRRLVQLGIEREVPAGGALGSDAATEAQEPIEPITLDDVAEVTRAVSEGLDASDAMGEQPYVLEVSSFGVDRPLTEYRHLRRNVGRLVTATLTGASAERLGASIPGRVRAVGSDVLVLADAGDETAQPTVIPLDDVAGARVEVEFTRAGTEEEDA